MKKTVTRITTLDSNGNPVTHYKEKIVRDGVIYTEERTENTNEQTGQRNQQGGFENFLNNPFFPFMNMTNLSEQRNNQTQNTQQTAQQNTQENNTNTQGQPRHIVINNIFSPLFIHPMHINNTHHNHEQQHNNQQQNHENQLNNQSTHNSNTHNPNNNTVFNLFNTIFNPFGALGNDIVFIIPQQNQQPKDYTENLKKLEKIKVNQENLENKNNTPFDNPCVICLNEYKNNEEVYKTPCSHIYHSKCLEQWFKENNTCPTCRKEM